jgi:hypothetical protein
VRSLYSEIAVLVNKRHRSENECRDVAVLRLYKGFRQRIIKFGRCLRDFQIKKYPTYFLWDGLPARHYLEQAGSPLHKIGEFISWKSLRKRVSIFLREPLRSTAFKIFFFKSTAIYPHLPWQITPANQHYSHYFQLLSPQK